MKKLGSVILVVSLPVLSVILPKVSETSLATLAAGLKGVASKLIPPELDVLAKEEIVTNEGRVTLVVSGTDPLLCSIVSTGMDTRVKVSEPSLVKNVVKLDGETKEVPSELEILVIESSVINCGSVNPVFSVVPLSVVIWVDSLISPASVVIPVDVGVDGVVGFNPPELVVDIAAVDVTLSPVSVDASNLGVVTERRLELKLLFGIPLETDLATVVVRKPNIVGIGLMMDDVVLVVSFVVIVAVVVIVVNLIVVVGVSVTLAIAVEIEMSGILLETAVVTVVVRKPKIVGTGLKMDEVVLVVPRVDSDEKSVWMFKVVGLAALEVVVVTEVVISAV